MINWFSESSSESSRAQQTLEGELKQKVDDQARSHALHRMSQAEWSLKDKQLSLSPGPVEEKPDIPAITKMLQEIEEALDKNIAREHEARAALSEQDQKRLENIVAKLGRALGLGNRDGTEQQLRRADYEFAHSMRKTSEQALADQKGKLESARLGVKIEANDANNRATGVPSFDMVDALQRQDELAREIRATEAPLASTRADYVAYERYYTDRGLNPRDPEVWKTNKTLPIEVYAELRSEMKKLLDTRRGSSGEAERLQDLLPIASLFYDRIVDLAEKHGVVLNMEMYKKAVKAGIHIVDVWNTQAGRVNDYRRYLGDTNGNSPGYFETGTYQLYELFRSSDIPAYEQWAYTIAFASGVLANGAPDGVDMDLTRWLTETMPDSETGEMYGLGTFVKPSSPRWYELHDQGTHSEQLAKRMNAAQDIVRDIAQTGGYVVPRWNHGYGRRMDFIRLDPIRVKPKQASTQRPRFS